MDDSDVGAGLHGRETPKVVKSLTALAVLAVVLAAFLISVRSVCDGTMQLERSTPDIIGVNQAVGRIEGKHENITDHAKLTVENDSATKAVSAIDGKHQTITDHANRIADNDPAMKALSQIEAIVQNFTVHAKRIADNDPATKAISQIEAILQKFIDHANRIAESDSATKAADGDGGGVPRGAPDSVYSAANTANLTESQVKQRQVIAAVGLGSATLVLFALAVVGLYKKRGRLSIGPLAIKSDAGLTWRGQPLTCSRPGQQHYTEVGDTEVAASGDIEVAAPGDTEVAAPNETGPVADSAAAISIADEDQAKEDDAVKAERLYDEQQRVMKKYHLWMAARKTLLLVLFIVYVGASVGIPWWKASSVSCENGLYWEHHLIFFGLFWCTKLFELGLLFFDPTIQGDIDIVPFAMTFVPSFLGYLDGYTDATSITIARSCGGDVAPALAQWMLGAYVAGVIVGQWMIAAAFALTDPTHACMMKILHLDVLAACTTLPEGHQNIWFGISMIRTFGEDLPQCVLQTLFVLYVKPNYFMLVSVAISAGSSVNALYNAFNRALAAMGATPMDYDSDEDLAFTGH